MDRYIAYCRKSSEEEDRQVMSIQSQIEELKRHAQRDHLEVVAVLQEAQSAKTPGRPIFNEMLKRIGRGEADGILAWHPDRLARNALDGGQIIHHLDLGKLRDLRFPTYTFENTPQGKFMLGIMFSQSKYYVDALSENIRRGNRARREAGWPTSSVPIGYLNGRSPAGEKIVVKDEQRFPLLSQLWELFLSGAYSLPQLLAIATGQMGLRTRKTKRLGGKSLTVSGIYRVFSNPFYCGYIVHQGQWLQGKHEPMITLDQFDRAQTLLGRPGRAKSKHHQFAFTGLVRCGTCDGRITAEKKRNRYGYQYVYYHCTHKKPQTLCREKCAEEDDLVGQILAFLETIHLDDHTVDEALRLIEEEKAKEHGIHAGVKQSVEDALGACQRNLDNLTRLRYRDLLTDEEFIRQRSELTREQETLKQRLQRLEAESWIEPSRRLFLFSNRAKFWLAHGEENERRLILSTVGSNLSLKDKKLSIDAKKPFRVLSERASFPDVWRLVNDVRTFFEQEPDYDIPTLPDPKQFIASATPAD
jgi:DNA invertase Pin-like site-specific DNA recombinase